MSLPHLSLTEQRGFIHDWQSKRDWEAVQKLCHHNIHWIVRRSRPFYRRFRIGFEDLIPAGYEGIQIAATRFNLERPTSFLSYGDSYVLKSLQKETAKQLGVAIGQIDGKNPLNKFLIEESLDQPITPDSDDSALDFIPDSTNDTQQLALRRYLTTELLAAVSLLPPRHFKILIQKYVFDQNNSQIGLEQGVSRNRIYQIECEAFSVIKQQLRTKFCNEDINDAFE